MLFKPEYRTTKIVGFFDSSTHYVVQRKSWYWPWWVSISPWADSCLLAEIWAEQFKNGTAYDWRGGYDD